MIPILESGRLDYGSPGKPCPVCDGRFRVVKSWAVRNGRVRRAGHGPGTTIACPCCRPALDLFRLLDGGPL